MKAIILAAGVGERLKPLTEVLPKPLLPIAGRPILATLLDGLRQCGVEDVGIVVSHMADRIRAFAGDGRDHGLTITYIPQGDPLGTGHALARAIEVIAAPVIVLAGDTAFSADHIRGVVRLFGDENADAALCLKRLPAERLHLASSVRLADGHRVTDIVEKPAPGEAPSDLAAALLHVYAPSLGDYLERLSVSPRGEYELTAATKMMIADGRVVVGREFPTPPDLTTADDFLRLNFAYIERMFGGAQPGHEEWSVSHGG